LGRELGPDHLGVSQSTAPVGTRSPPINAQESVEYTDETVPPLGQYTRNATRRGLATMVWIVRNHIGYHFTSRCLLYLDAI
jgi:hypothetical protein